eukprot:scaffold23824_cov174-Isochrysis_galbana.AAC.1
MDLQHRWVKWRGSLAHPVVLRWVARTFRRRGDVHDGVVRRRGRTKERRARQRAGAPCEPNNRFTSYI